MTKYKYEYEVKKPGSISFIKDNGRPFILETKSKSIPGNLITGIELEYNFVNIPIPFGAGRDGNFIFNIRKAKSIEEVKDICETWTNV